MECSICLEEIKEPYQLSCNHNYHYSCFIKMCINNKNSFINCPLCRQKNQEHIEFKEPGESIKYFYKKVNRCQCRTKSGHICKKNAKFMNYGYCQFHHKLIEMDQRQEKLFYKYIRHIFETQNTLYTKIYLIDIVRKLIVKDTTIQELSDILNRILRFYNDYKQQNKINNRIIDHNDLYNYYDLDIPPEEWIQKCMKYKLLV